MGAPRSGRRERGLTHLDEDGRARMVDVGAKADSERRAVARGAAADVARDRAGGRGGRRPEGRGARRWRGSPGSRRRSRPRTLIPLAHPLPLTFVDVDGARRRRARAWSSSSPRRAPSASTGVEMEAMTACAVAALTVYDMVKGARARGRDRAGRAAREERRAQRDWRRETATLSRARRACGRRSSPSRTSRGARRGRGRERRRGSPRSRPGWAPRSPAGEIVPDDRELIAARLRHWADEERLRPGPDQRRHRLRARRRHPGGDAAR